jgi:hypothetical protein
MPKSRRRYGPRNDNVLEAEAVVWADVWCRYREAHRSA